ncbi:MAG: N-acetylmuramoyl-L-alanine amidase [Oscillospiraceae bacterium]
MTVHNTSWITTATGTTPAEQYTRATVNDNMNDVRVNYYVDNTCAWQDLPLSLSGWHAADGSGNGNRRTIAIECIMSSAYNSVDKKSEDNCARLAAALLKKYNLDISHLFTHTHWLNVRMVKVVLWIISIQQEMLTRCVLSTFCLTGQSSRKRYRCI